MEIERLRGRSLCHGIRKLHRCMPSRDVARNRCSGMTASCQRNSGVWSKNCLHGQLPRGNNKESQEYREAGVAKRPQRLA